MRSYFVLLLLLPLGAFTAAAQTAKPSPTAPIEGEVVKISTNLIQMDFSVTDSKGRPITDLKPEEVEVYENGKKQRITSFNFFSDKREITKPVESKKKSQIDVPIPGSEIRPEQVRRTFALVVDDLSLSFDSANSTRIALKKFVDEQMQNGDLVAIIRTGAGMGSLQQFTSDKRLLYAAIEKVRWNPLGTGGLSAFAPIEPTPREQAASMGLIARNAADAQAEKNRLTALNDLRNSIFASGTLGAIRYLVNGMSQLPGRKSIILFSNGFRIFTRDEDGYEDGTYMLALVRELIDQANRASVVINTIDVRGLVYTGYSAADTVTDMSVGANTTSMNDRSDELFETQHSLSIISKETGGLTIQNSNDLSEGVSRVLEDQSYYLAAYEPDDETFDAAKAKFNKISVHVLRPGASVRSRSGFFNNTDQRNSQAGAPATPYRQIMDALGSPFAHSGIELRLNPLFGYDERNGSFVRSYLHINAQNLKFSEESNGKRKATISIVAASFGDTGKPTHQVSNSYTISVDEKEYRKILNDGIVYNFTFPVKQPGGFQYRVAIRDDLAGVVGSASQFVQIPKIKKGSLVLSSMVVQSLTPDEWKKQSAGAKIESDPMNATSARRFRQGSILQYAFELYGLEPDVARSGMLARKVRVFRDGKLILDGSEIPLVLRSSGGKYLSSGAISLGAEMEPGDYILQLVVIDNSKKENKRYATQVVQFEVVN